MFTLGHSRAMYADVATAQRLEMFLRLHEAAFEALGGIPDEILYDRIKTVVLGTDERGEVRWHPIFLDFARSWGFRPRLCRPYRAQTKGKVESGIRYVKGSFLPGREASAVVDLRSQLHAWVAAVANQRVHGTTHRIVREAWEAERPHLQPLADRPPYPYIPEVTRRVSRDAYVAYGANRYSVPGRWPVATSGCARSPVIWKCMLPLSASPFTRCARIATRSSRSASGIPLHSALRSTLDKITIQVRPPDVEVRPLAVYAAVGDGGEGE